MKALFIGLGSIGKRHLEVLNELVNTKVYCVSHTHGSKIDMEFRKKFELEIYDKLDDAISVRPDFAVIANPTSLHVETALTLSEARIPFLLEKPVSDRLEGMETLLQIVNERKIPVMVGFQLRFHPGYRKMTDIIASGAIGTPLHVHGYVGQHLSEWRPGTDYRTCYSAKADLGGGVILDLSHELDIAISILGGVAKVSCIAGRCSDLDIETEDVADIILEHQCHMLSTIHLNYLERTYAWCTRVIGEKGSVLWDYGNGFVELYLADGSKERSVDPPGYKRNDMFREQMRHWLGTLEGRKAPEVDLNHGIYVTKIALAAKQSARENRHIFL